MALGADAFQFLESSRTKTAEEHFCSLLEPPARIKALGNSPLGIVFLGCDICVLHNPVRSPAIWDSPVVPRIETQSQEA